MSMYRRIVVAGRILSLSKQLATGEVCECRCGQQFGGPDALANLSQHQYGHYWQQKFSRGERN